MSDLVQFDTGTLKKSLPRSLRNRVTDELVDELNGIVADPLLRENFKENMLSYVGVMQEGKYRLDKYISAVKYVSYKLLGASNVEAYSKTFPDRVKRLLDEGADDKTISSYVAAYNKTQLVNRILEQTLVPVHILNAHIYQKAINVQADLMSNAASEKVRTDAANSLLNHLKAPEVSKVQIDVGIKHDKSIDTLKTAINELAAVQQKGIQMKDIAADDAAKATLVMEADYEEIK